MSTFGERVREARTSLRLTQVQLATLCGLCQSHISMIEIGHRDASRPMLERLASALQCSAGWLVTGTDDSPLCAEVATIPVAQIHFLAQVARRHGEGAAADKVEAWLRDAVGDSIPF